MRGLSGLIPFLLAAALSACASDQTITQDLENEDFDKQVGPFQSCLWDYLNGLPPFKNSASHPGHDPAFNPTITVSRRGLTARVVGVLPEDFVNRYGGSMDRIVEAFPYITPVSYTAMHTPRPEDISRPSTFRAANPAGEVIKTEVVSLPPSTVMIVYPVSIAKEGYNTAAGTWRLHFKSRGVSNTSVGNFGLFPFLRYTNRGHAFHGPIEGDRSTDMWTLSRGKVSSGCQRMDGEHIVELSVLLGCPARGNAARCSFANEIVTVIEEFDHVPDPDLSYHDTGVVNSFETILTQWVVVDLAEYPRDESYPIPDKLQAGPNMIRLSATDNKGWVRPPEQSFPGLRATEGLATKRYFPIWDNRITSVTTRRPLVVGRGCSE